MIFSKLIKIVAAELLAAAAFLALASMLAGASPKVTVLAFGLFGAQSVFESEAKGAASIDAASPAAGPFASLFCGLFLVIAASVLD
jgi:hypothetical protein